jgi:hypothetical protein
LFHVEDSARRIAATSWDLFLKLFADRSAMTIAMLRTALHVLTKASA